MNAFFFLPFLSCSFFLRLSALNSILVLYKSGCMKEDSGFAYVCVCVKELTSYKSGILLDQYNIPYTDVCSQDISIPGARDWLHFWRKCNVTLVPRPPWHKFCGLNLLAKYTVWFWHTKIFLRRSQWPLDLRRGSAAARFLRLWVWIPLGAWMSVCCDCCVLSGRGLCDELITRPE